MIENQIYEGTTGHYAVAAATATVAAGQGANSEILQFRWTDTSKLALIQEVRIDAFNSLVTGFAAGIGQFDLTAARSWTAAGTGGGALTLTGDNNKLKTGMATTAVGEIRVATTAALGAGTKTLDGNRISYTRLNISTTASNVFISTPVYLLQTNLKKGDCPLILAANEGFVVRATVPATGTWDIYLGVRWVEAFKY